MTGWTRKRKSENWPLDFVLRRPSEAFKVEFFALAVFLSLKCPTDLLVILLK